jgi:hypothetical protein
MDINVVRANPEAQKISNNKILFNIKVENITPECIALTDKQGDRGLSCIIRVRIPSKK